MRAPTFFAATALAAGTLLLLGGASPGLAQGNPNADQLMQMLRPGGGSMGTGTRGLGPARPPSTSADPGSATGGGGTGIAPSRPMGTGGAVSPAATAPGHAAMPRPPTAGGMPSQPPAATAAPSVNLTVQFANNSAELTPAATRTLDELGRALSSQALSSYRFRIEGHTDAVGSRDHNKMLSEQRAAKVVEYLTAKFNLDRGKLEPIGMGQDQPLVPSPPNVSQPRNRRVTVVNLGT